MSLNQVRFSTFLLLILFMAISCTPATKNSVNNEVTIKDQADVHYKMGLIYLEEQKLGDSLRELTEAVKIFPDEPTYYNALGTAYFLKRMNEEAEFNYKKAVALNPKYSEAFLNLSSVFIEEGKWDLAIAAAENVFNNVFYPSPQNAYNNIGWALFKKGEFLQSIVNYRKAIDIQSNYTMAYNNMGLSYERLSKWDKALSAYDAAMKSNPAIPNPYFNKGFLLMNLNRNAESVETFEELIKVAPGTGEAESAREYIEIMK